MTTAKMPLPAHRGPPEAGSYFDSFTTEQMKRYGDDRAKEALEMAAKVCEELHYTWRMGDNSGPKECTAAIRALKEKI